MVDAGYRVWWTQGIGYVEVGYRVWWRQGIGYGGGRVYGMVEAGCRYGVAGGRSWDISSC